jgi:hypothetical protein
MGCHVIGQRHEASLFAIAVVAIVYREAVALHVPYNPSFPEAIIRRAT